MQDLCKNDLSYLVTEVLDEKYYKPLLAPVHYEMMDFAAKPGRRKLLLIPRGHLKSSLITIPLTIQALLKDPDSRILITSAVLGNSSDFLRSIKGYFESNEVLKALFGDFVSDKWNEVEIVIKQRKKKQIKESSVMASSVDKGIVSKHFNFIVADDLVNRETINTKEQLEKTITYYKDLLDLLDPDGTLILIGTRWHFDDIYAYILEEDKKRVEKGLSPLFEVFFRSVFNEDGSTIFPQKFTSEYVEQLKHEKGSDFSAQYLNNPIDDENADFKVDWIKEYEVLPDKMFNYFLTLDTNGGGETKNSDYNGWCLNAVDTDGVWWIVDLMHDKANVTEIINRLFFYAERYPYLKIGLEKTMFVNAFYQELQREMQKRGRFLNIEELKHNSTSKETRIKSLIPLFQNGMIRTKANRDFTDEFIRFPKSSHDDILDCLAMQQEIVYKPFNESEDEDIGIYNKVNYN